MLFLSILKLNGGLMESPEVMWGDGVIVARYLYIPATVVYIDG
jgi:hypothetical protein